MLALSLTTPAAADVVSRAPDAVAVTVYRDHAATAASLRAESGDTAGLAMIAETRTVELPAGRTRISFEGVADAIIPASAALTGLPGRLVERNFDYDLLDPGSLIEKSVGQSVTIRRTNPKTGKVTEEPATLRSGPDGVVAVTAGGVEALNCGTGPQALVSDHLPPGLADRPTLSVIVDAPHAGRYTLTLSYLTVRIDWSADYVARLSADGTTLDLTGWLTLSNRSGASFAGAPTSVVAGALARLPPDLPDIAPKQVERECWPMGTTSDFVRREVAGRLQDEALAEVPAPPPPASVADMANAPIVSKSEARRAVQTNLGDYKLYSLVEPTTVAAMQTKQIRFLHQTGVKFETLYVVRENAYVGQAAQAPVPEQDRGRAWPGAAGRHGLDPPAARRGRALRRRARRARRADERGVRAGSRRGVGCGGAGRRGVGPVGGFGLGAAPAPGAAVHPDQRQAHAGDLRAAPVAGARGLPDRRRIQPARAEERRRRLAGHAAGERDGDAELCVRGAVTPSPSRGGGQGVGGCW